MHPHNPFNVKKSRVPQTHGSMHAVGPSSHLCRGAVGLHPRCDGNVLGRRAPAVGGTGAGGASAGARASGRWRRPTERVQQRAVLVELRKECIGNRVGEEVYAQPQ